MALGGRIRRDCRDHLPVLLQFVTFAAQGACPRPTWIPLLTLRADHADSAGCDVEARPGAFPRRTPEGMRMPDEFCSHGLIQLSKYGADVDERGIDTCRRCGRATRDSYLKVAAAERRPPPQFRPRPFARQAAAPGTRWSRSSSPGVLVAAAGAVIAGLSLPTLTTDSSGARTPQPASTQPGYAERHDRESAHIAPTSTSTQPSPPTPATPVSGPSAHPQEPPSRASTRES